MAILGWIRDGSERGRLSPCSFSATPLRFITLRTTCRTRTADILYDRASEKGEGRGRECARLIMRQVREIVRSG